MQPKCPVNSSTRTLFSSRHIMISSRHASLPSKWSLRNVSTLITAHHTTLIIRLYTMSRGNGQEKACFVSHSNVCGRKERVYVRQQATLAAHDNSWCIRTRTQRNNAKFAFSNLVGSLLLSFLCCLDVLYLLLLPTKTSCWSRGVSVFLLWLHSAFFPASQTVKHSYAPRAESS